MRRAISIILFTSLILLVFALPAIAGPLPGAIFTTLSDGSRVNANIYASKEDVYLDGGPGVRAPSTAAALPPGDYYFQVTDPSGKVLLSVDPIESRKVRVNAHGVIDLVYPAPTTTKYRGTSYGTHLTGTDADHADKGAITVQLMPYNDTPNKGGVYKVWMTPCERYSSGQGFHGFIPAWSKTDNYKAKGQPRIQPTYVEVRKFHDLNANGVWDDGEPELSWDVEVTDPLGSDVTLATPFTKLVAPGGMWYFEEIFPAPDGDCSPGWMPTALYVDGVAQPVSPKIGVELAENAGKTVTIVFGNVELASVDAVKFYDADVDGSWGPSEQPIAGWRIALTGTNVRGEGVELLAETDVNGQVNFCGLLPGEYRVAEVMAAGDWVATTPEFRDLSLTGGSCEYVEFGNVCLTYVDFNTKGFWHNKNGLELIDVTWIAYVNDLAPFRDNPFDGLDADGNPVPAAKGPAGENIAAEGTALAEISAYLVDSSAGGDPRIQLGQQLLAFIFNVKHTGAGTLWCDEGLRDAESMISDAVAAWGAGGSAANDCSQILDTHNNDDMVKIAKCTPCAVEYPALQ